MRKNILILIVIFGILAVLIGKVFIASSPNAPLYLYGILVTFIGLITFGITFTKYKDPYILAQAIPAEKRKKYSVSCLVAVRNEEKIIEQCILSMINQTYKNKEIIIVNDASNDNTKQVLDKYAKSGLINVIHLKENVGKKKALAQGMLKAKGEIFAFSDSDSVWAPDALEKVIDVFSIDPLIGAVSGHCRVLNAEKNIWTKVQDSWYEGQYSIRKAFESVYGAVTCVSGPLAVFRREAIFNYIPAWEHDKFLGQEFRFATDRTLTGFVLGSIAIGSKLKKKYAGSPFLSVDYPAKDWKIVYCKSAKAWTAVPETFKKMCLQQIRWKKSFIRNIFFTGKFYWRKPILTATGYYLHILFVLAGPFIAFRHLVYLPLQGNIYSALLYLAGITFVGLMFGIAYKLENKDCNRWVYRPIMSLLSSLIYCWLIFYSIVTIKRNIWVRG
ncbi:MAG: glycosyltransferase [Nanoarchaeota archaeon]